MYCRHKKTNTMAVPKKKTSFSKKRKRRNHSSTKKLNITFNKVTGEPKLLHYKLVNENFK